MYQNLESVSRKLHQIFFQNIEYLVSLPLNNFNLGHLVHS